MKRRDFLSASISAFATLLGIPGVSLSKVAIPETVEPSNAAFSAAVGDVIESMWIAASRRIELDDWYEGTK